MDQEQWEDVTENFNSVQDFVKIGTSTSRFGDIWMQDNPQYCLTKEVMRCWVGSSKDGTYEDVDAIRVWRKRRRND